MHALVASTAWCIAALEVIPYTLAENAGMNPISIVTELRSEHAKGKVGAGENTSKNLRVVEVNTSYSSICCTLPLSCVTIQRYLV